MHKDISGPENHQHNNLSKQKDQIQQLFHAIAYIHHSLPSYTTNDHKCAYLKPPGQKVKQSESGLLQKIPHKWYNE